MMMIMTMRTMMLTMMKTPSTDRVYLSIRRNFSVPWALTHSAGVRPCTHHCALHFYLQGNQTERLNTTPKGAPIQGQSWNSGLSYVFWLSLVTPDGRHLLQNSRCPRNQNIPPWFCLLTKNFHRRKKVWCSTNLIGINTKNPASDIGVNTEDHRSRRASH